MNKNKPNSEPRTLQSERRESLLEGDNAVYLEALYEQYLQDPKAVGEHWRRYFSQLPAVNGHRHETRHSEVRDYFRNFSAKPVATLDTCSTLYHSAFEHDRKQVQVLQLINAYRFLGHFRAKTNPLGTSSSVDPVELTLAHHQLDTNDLNRAFNTGSLVAPAEMTLAAIIEQLQQTYCGSIGVEYMHMSGTEEKRWIQRHLESVRASPEYSRSQRRYILDRLTAAEVLERFLHSKYVGQKRFSLEGAESLIPLLDELIQSAGGKGVKEVVMGMAHRGRLNVLVNILGKSPALLFKEFEGTNDHHNRTGDVKYHMGFSSDMNTPGGPIHVAMAFNPSHLEIVGPVVEGAVRARQDRWQKHPGDKVLPVVIHGDAAFAGQGVIMETLNMSNTRGFKTRGTVRIIINNQIGFTNSFQRDARSSFYCSDVAKMVSAPIFHVNGDDPEAVVFITQMALDYRMRFHQDVVIDLVCYRRHGHNEADEPAVTQPKMYKIIRQLSSTRELYEQQLVNQHVISQAKATDLVSVSRKRLELGDPVIPHLLDSGLIERAHPISWKGFYDASWDSDVPTTLTEQQYDALGLALCQLPQDLAIHPRVSRIIDARRQMSQHEQALDWGFCETLAYASLLEQGYPVRLCGQDSGRGTFFHRHAVLHDQNDGHEWIPLKKLSKTQASFTVIDSLLSEEAVLAFEYGYATTEPNALVIWEAQFGDFANGAQVVIDQFISSGEQKWGRLSGLVMFLPHGFEGQGPEHSSARLERYLQLCAQHNMQVCVPSTPAQTFHMLRRQLLRQYRKPLIVMTPKSLLRHPLAISQVEDITQGQFQVLIGEIDDHEPKQISRLILCTGKVYYDLLEKRRDLKLEHIAIIRIEQLYPFPEAALCEVIRAYPNVVNYLWCQEEPLNQGAWYNQQHHIRLAIGDKAKLQHATRPASASPAAGSLKTHRAEQEQLIADALGLTSE